MENVFTYPGSLEYGFTKPTDERSVQVLEFRCRKQCAEFRQYLDDFFHGMRALKTDKQGGKFVGSDQIFRWNTTGIQKKILLLWLIRLKGFPVWLRVHAGLSALSTQSRRYRGPAGTLAATCRLF